MYWYFFYSPSNIDYSATFRQNYTVRPTLFTSNQLMETGLIHSFFFPFFFLQNFKSWLQIRLTNPNIVIPITLWRFWLTPSSCFSLPHPLVLSVTCGSTRSFSQWIWTKWLYPTWGRTVPRSGLCLQGRVGPGTSLEVTHGSKLLIKAVWLRISFRAAFSFVFRVFYSAVDYIVF